MATTMVMPQLGQTMEEGTINKWFKKEGDPVQKGEPLLEVMTDKVNMEVESPVSGVLLKMLAEEGSTIPVQQPIAVLGEPGEKVAEAAAPAPEAKAEVSVPTPSQIPPSPSAEAAPVEHRVSIAEERIFISPRARKLAEENKIDIADLAGHGTGPEGRIVEQDVLSYLEGAPAAERVKATPVAQKLAEDLGVDLSKVIGTGPAGRITRDDVEKVAAAKAAPAPAPAAPAPTAPIAPAATAPVGGAQVVLKGSRKVIADRVSESKRQKPHVTLVCPVDMSAAVKLRAQVGAAFEAKYGQKLTYNDMIVKAVATALAEESNRIVNSTIEGDTITMHENAHVGIAVALEFGLIVPVLRDADKKPLGQISKEARDLATRARTNQLMPDELAGGTFTISNLGAFGVQSFDPIILPPQSTILGVGAIEEKPVVRNGNIEVGSVMNLCISFDHRVMDGVPPAKFLQRVRQILEEPYLLLV